MEEKHVATLKVSPAAAGIPKMTTEERADLLEDIRANGVLEPVKLAADGVTILDGRHRYELSVELGLDTIPTEPADLRGLTEEEYALKAALLRRNMTPDQRAVQAARLADGDIAASKKARAAKGGRARADKAAGVQNDNSTPAGASSDHAPKKKRVAEEAAMECGTSVTRVKQARALKKKSPALLAQVAEGKIKLSTALAQIERDEKPTVSGGHESMNLALDLGSVIEDGKYSARFIGMVRTPWLKEVNLVWQLTSIPHENELLIQKFPDAISANKWVGMASKLFQTLIQITGEASEIGKPPIRIANFSGSTYELTVKKKGKGPSIVDVGPLTTETPSKDLNRTRALP